MSKVEVLVACMHRKDDSLYKEMNLQTDAVLACQGEKYFYEEYRQGNNCIAKLISTSDRGVGKNRNKALMNASGEYLLFADEDMIYENGYEKIVLDAFQKRNADMLIFNLVFLNQLLKEKTSGSKYKRIRIWNSMRYGAPRIAIKRSVVEKNRLFFSTLYGGGAKYSSGEDSLFIRDAIKKGLKVYYCPISIAKVKQESSSWFNGYTDKFFIDKGVWLANAFPVLCYALVYYFSFGLRNVSPNYTFSRILSLMKHGIREFKKI